VASSEAQSGEVQFEHHGVLETAVFECSGGTIRVTWRFGFSHHDAAGAPREQALALFRSMLETADALQSDQERPDIDEPLCDCDSGAARAEQFGSTPIGIDPTEGRFAEVTLERCRTCERLWVRYLVEHEGFSRSGRWARGLISETTAAALKPEDAEPHLRALSSYLYGGSYFDGQWRRRSGRMDW